MWVLSHCRVLGLFVCFCFFFFLAELGLLCCTWAFSSGLWVTGSVVVAHRLSCSTACGILVPQPGIKPASPALEGGFLTTGPAGKTLPCSLSLHYDFSPNICVITYTCAYVSIWGFPGHSVVKNPPANAGDVGSIPGSGRSPREGNGNPLQYSCLGNSMDRKEPGRLQSMGLQTSGCHLMTKQQQCVSTYMCMSVSFLPPSLSFSLFSFFLSNFSNFIEM